MALQGIVDTKFFCECNPASIAIIEARMNDGSIPRAQIVKDVSPSVLSNMSCNSQHTHAHTSQVCCLKRSEVKLLKQPKTRKALPSNIEAATVGWPCQDICCAGTKKGLEGKNMCDIVCVFMCACEFSVLMFACSCCRRHIIHRVGNSAIIYASRVTNNNSTSS
jgi:hypothetical protein